MVYQVLRKLTLIGAVIYCASLLAPQFCHAETQSISLWKDNSQNAFTQAFLELALSKVDSPYTNELLASGFDGNREKAFELLVSGNEIDLLVSAIGSSYNPKLRRLSIPLDRGLLGIRLCMIDSRFQEQFQNLNTLKDMRDNRIVFLQGEGWPDIDILRANGVRVHTFGPKDDVESIMQSHRPYCFSRSLLEIEQELHQYPNLVLEQSIAIIYPLADIVYLNEGNGELSDYLQLGLERAVEDGSYYSLFDELYGNVFEEYQFYSRKIFFFQNPSLTDEERQMLNKYGVMSYIDAD